MLESSAEFEKYGMKALGWYGPRTMYLSQHNCHTLTMYHSHPRIKPMPSTKDLSTQLQLQSMIPYCIGIIAGIYSATANLGSSSKQYKRASDSSQLSISNSYFSFFRAVEDEEGKACCTFSQPAFCADLLIGKAGVAVNVTVHRHARAPHAATPACLSLPRRLPLIPPCILQGMCRALRSPPPPAPSPLPNPSTFLPSVVLAENEECHKRRLAACRTDEERILESTSYGRVLSLFRISSLFPLKRFVMEQGRQLKWSAATCTAATSSKSVLATAPMALPLSVMEGRWAGSRPVHFLNSAPVEEFDFEIDDGAVAKASGSARKRNQPISSEGSSPERAAAVPLSSLAAAAADVSQAAEESSFEQGGGSDRGFVQQEQPNVRGGGRRRQQTPPPHTTRRQSESADVVVVDDD